MNRHAFVRLAAVLTAIALAAPVAAETLLVDRVKIKPAATVPARGLSMQEVESRFGTPQEKLAPRGGQKKQWPTINRWVYPDFTVYFEKSRVIDVVAHRASANEVGPKPAIR